MMDGVWCDFREIGVHGRSSFHTPYVLKRHFSQNFSHSLTEVTLLLPDLHAYDTAASAGCASKLERAARRPRQGAGLLPLGEEVLSTARARRASVRTVCSRTRSVGAGVGVRRSDAHDQREPHEQGVFYRAKKFYPTTLARRREEYAIWRRDL